MGRNYTIYTNVITNCTVGFYKAKTVGGDVFYANHVENNTFGIQFSFCQDDGEITVYHNNLINNVHQVIKDITDVGASSSSRLYFFDNDNEGNYWSNYNGTDSDDNGIGDTPYIIGFNCSDNYPLMTAFDISSALVQEPFSVLPIYIATILALVVAVGIVYHFKCYRQSYREKNVTIKKFINRCIALALSLRKQPQLTNNTLPFPDIFEIIFR